jgi:hypothetical protein
LEEIWLGNLEYEGKREKQEGRREREYPKVCSDFGIYGQTPDRLKTQDLGSFVPFVVHHLR